MTWTRRTLCAALAMVAAVGTGTLVGAEAAADSNQYRGTSDCERCHKSGPTETDKQQGVLDRVQLNEAVIWRKQDRHSAAYRNLNSDLGKSIGKLLDADVFNSSTGCIECHSTSIDLLRPENKAVDPTKEEGVGCEACHGPSSNWVETHRKYPDWLKTPANSKTDAGWVDLWSPVSRAEACLSCHVGSAPRNRVITHAMYAAGHPPLLGFEIESFAEKMPRHWRYAYEKSAAAHDSYERTRNVLAASVVAARLAVELALADAQGGQHWPEFARLDCFACHHDLDGKRSRPTHDTDGVPGRPRLLVGSFPLMTVAVRLMDGPAADQELNQLELQLQAPFATSAFGDPAEFTARGLSIVAWCRSVEGRLESANIQRNQARAVLHEIAKQATGEECDFDAARQLFGAWSIVYEELVVNKALRLPDDAQRRVDQILGKIGKSDPFVLEPGRAGDSAAQPPAGHLVSESLPKLFENRVKYDPVSFAKVMSTLDQLTAAASTGGNQ